MKRKERETAVESLDFSALGEEHVNKWVVLSRDYKKVLATGNSLKAVLDKAADKDAVVVQVLPHLGYAPLSQ